MQGLNIIGMFCNQLEIQFMVIASKNLAGEIFLTVLHHRAHPTTDLCNIRSSLLPNTEKTSTAFEFLARNISTCVMIVLIDLLDNTRYKPYYDPMAKISLLTDMGPSTTTELEMLKY